MKKLVLAILLTTSAVVTLPAQASAAVVTIDFETTDDGSPTIAGNAIGAGDYDAYGATFSGGFYYACGGGCPDPALGTFASGRSFISPMTVSFANPTTLFSFENVSNSSGSAQAFDAANTLLQTINFSGFPSLLTFDPASISSVTFSTTFQYGVDNFTFNYGGAVPEPSTWAMMILGLGLVGGAMRKRQQAKVGFAF